MPEIIGFIGLGNVGGKLAESLIRNSCSLKVFDIDPKPVSHFKNIGAEPCSSPAEVATKCDVLFTCLPSPKVSTEVMEGPAGVLEGFSAGKMWCEMSTTDEVELKRVAGQVVQIGGQAADCPVSGGCHRAASGNISIFAGCKREMFEKILPILTKMGRKILHTGDLGSATVLKLLTNYLASANLLSICEALATAKLNDIDLNMAYEAIRISSGNSFVHETESQVILNGSRNINFTMDLVVKDVGLFQNLADRVGLKLNLSPLLVSVFKQAEATYGAKEWSPNVIRLYEDQVHTQILGRGFPPEIIDSEPEIDGAEVKIQFE